MVYRMLALDIDGTLLQNNHRLNRRTKEAIAFVKNKGVYVTLVTERHFYSAQKVAKALKLDSILVTQSGAFIAASVDSPISEHRLAPEVARRLIKTLEAYNCHIRVSHERFSIENRVSQKKELIAKMTMGIGDPLFYPVTFVDSLADYLSDNDISPTAVEVHFFEEADKAIKNTLSLFPETEVNQLAGNRCEWVARGASKMNGLQTLARYLGILESEIVAVGDAVADKAMITRAGLGVAVKNAPDEVKRAADWITRSNDQLGVSYTVKEVFRKQFRKQL